MKIADALHDAELLARDQNIPPADFLYLLSELTGLNPIELKMERDQDLSPSQIRIWQEYSKRRTNGEPSQYITGKAWFFGYELHVGPEVLIPRPETEGLVELALKNSSSQQRVIDIGTGSGAIAIALKAQRPDFMVTATDISRSALAVAAANAIRLNVEIEFINADLFPDNDLRYDLIISNPPYISREDYDLLPVHIREHEPQSALLAEDGGLDYYTRILERISQKANPGALICFEIGSGQAERIKAIAKKQGLDKIDIMVDSASLDRYVLIKNL